jgi:hypothetical protein
MPADQHPLAWSPGHDIFPRKNANLNPAVERHRHCTTTARPMPYFHLQSALATVAACLALLGGGYAFAQTGTGGIISASALTASDFSVKFESYDPGQKDWVLLNDTQAAYYFNRARCECNGDTTKYTGYVQIAIQPASTTEAKVRQNLAVNGVNAGGARLLLGGSAYPCLSPGLAGVKQNCLNLMDPSNYDAEIPGGISAISSVRVWESPPIPVAWFFGSALTPNMCGPGGGGSCDSTSSCASAATKRILYLWAETSGNGTPDSGDIHWDVNVVGEVGLTPTDVSVTGGNEALEVSWKWPAGQNPSASSSVFMGIQIFCVRGADYDVFPDKTFTPAYMTAITTCPDVVGIGTGALAEYDPKYLCSGLLPSTANGYRITGLQNDIPYGVAVAAIDKYYNVSALSNLVYEKPIPTIDFYTEYTRMGGTAQGGYCALAPGRTGPGMLAIAALAMLAFVLRRKGKRQRPGAGPLGLVLLAGTLAAGTAQAQALYHDDMFIETQEREPWKGTPREFAIEARFALYTPAVDSEFSGSKAGPQAFVFGDSKRPMWQLEFDWEILQVFGTLAVGGSVGYFKENAKSCDLEGLLDDRNDPNVTMTCTRSRDNTSLRLIPIAALVIYRFDVLAEYWKIPLVPYGKLGLNYTLWKVTDGNGYTPSAGGGHGAGGTMGWQAAVGISLQLDWIDPGAARGFDADAGVNHTYAFFELDTIQSSGLGSANKLHVGDNTWFAGLMFEF